MSEDTILKEGAAGDHMMHPFDLPKIKSGKDLVDYFEKAASWLEQNPGSLKLDGANTSFKIIGEPGEKRFAVDRGSMKPADLAGITADNVEARFPQEGHGMRTAIPFQLKVLDNAFAELGGLEKAAEKNKVLKAMIEDPSFYLNAEFVQRDEEGRSPNVVQYDHDFIALHGLKQFYEKFNRQQEKMRSGAERPEGVKAVGIDITGEDISSAIREIVSIADKEARKHNFRVHGDIPTQKAANTEKIDLSAALSTPITIWEDSEGEKITKSLSQWLSEVSNPGYEKVVLTDGRKLHALHKDLYLNVMEAGIPLDQIIEDPSQRQKARDGAIIMHATRLLGQEVKNSLEADAFGSLQDEEGAIIRSPEINEVPNAVKFTGDFIVQGMSGLIKQKMAAEKEPSLTEELTQKTVAVIPGGFKPPHRGHFDMVKHYAEIADEVKVLISPLARKTPSGREITLQDSKDLFELYADREGLTNVEVMKSPDNSPVRAAYDYVSEIAIPGEKVILGTSTKGGDQERFAKDVAQYAAEGVEVLNPMEHAFDPQPPELSATDFRAAIDAEEGIEEFIPANVEVEEVTQILGNEDPTSESSLDEMSSGGGGAVSGPPGVRDDLPENYFIKREDLMKEMHLRETIRKVLSKAYFEKNKTRILEEQKLRKVIRKFITEAREADEVVYKNTGINKLRDLLRRIIPVIQDDYRDLTTSIEQRESFTKHLLIGIQNLLGISDLSKGVEKLPLQESIEEDIEVEIGKQAEDPGVMDVGLGGEELVDTPEDVEEEEELSDEEKLVSGGEMPTDPNVLTGMRASARTLKKVQTQIKDMYEELSNPEDEKAFAEYILPNIKAHLDDFEAEISDTTPEPEVVSPEGSVEVEDEETVEDQFELSEEVLHSIANLA